MHMHMYMHMYMHMHSIQASQLVESLGGDFVAEKMLSTFDNLLRDESVDERVELTVVLMCLAEPLGASIAKAQLLPIMRLLVDDANTNVRLAVINRFASFVTLVGPGSSTQDEDGGLVSLLTRLALDANWRVRHAALLLMPTLAATLDKASFATAFPVKGFAHRAIDSCSLIRRDWVQACVDIAKLPSYSSAWLEEAVVPLLCARNEEKLYQKRAVLLDGMARLAPHLRVEVLEETLLPLALLMITDKVPNLRLLLANALGDASPHVSLQTVASKVRPALTKLASDEDQDVVEAAQQAMAVCSKHADDRL